MKWLWIVILMLTTSCGIGLEDTSGSNADREIKNDKLRAEYESVRGTYEGFLRLPNVNQRFPIRFFVWTGEVQEAPMLGDLKPGVRVVLRGRLIQTQFIGDSDNLIMTGQYDGATGRLRLDPDDEMSKTSTGCRLGGQDPITIAGIASPGKIGGSVLRNGQEWGTLEDMQRVSLDVSTGSALSEEQEYQRLQDTYRPVTGMYRGQLTRRVCNTDRQEDFSLWLYIERVQEGIGVNGSPCHVPRLRLRTLRNLAGELADVTYRSLNRFDPNSFLPQFTNDAAKLNLAYNNSQLVGDISTTGLWGRFQVSRYSDEVVAPDDESQLLRERLDRTFAPFIGEYRGKVEAYEGRDWPVNMKIYLTEGTDLNGIRRPFLMSVYKRTDFSDDTIGMRQLDITASIDGCYPALYMKSEAIPGGRVPGLGLMLFTTDFKDNRMEGELVDHRGPQGILTLRRR